MELENQVNKENINRLYKFQSSLESIKLTILKKDNKSIRKKSQEKTKQLIQATKVYLLLWM